MLATGTRARLKASVPGLQVSLLGSIIWSVCMALSVFVALIIRQWDHGGNFGVIIGVFAVGGLLAFVPALILARFVASEGQVSQRFAAAFVALTLATLGASYFVYYLQFRVYYSQWHGDIFSFVWFLQTFVTALSAAYQFAVLGSRFFFPLGLVFLFAMSFWLAKNEV
jgi:hypothetical protein